MHLLAPCAQQVAAPSRITLALAAGRADPIGTKRTIGAAQFAPRNDDSHLVEEAQRQGPDQPLAGHLLRVGVIDVQFGLVADGMAKHVQRHGVLRKTITRRARHHGGIAQRFLSLRIEHGSNFRQRIRRGFAQDFVTALIDVTQTEDDGFGFVGIEHQRRQKQAAAQHITNPRLAMDRRAEGGQFRDIAIERALGHFQLGSQGRRRHRALLAAQHLQQSQKTSGTRHVGQALEGKDVRA